MELIDKDALVAEIKKRLLPVAIDKHYDEWERGQDSERMAILDIINTLEVKEVEEPIIPKEISYEDYLKFFVEHPEYSDGAWGFDECWTFADYCYKLALKPQKGE